MHTTSDILFKHPTTVPYNTERC